MDPNPVLIVLHGGHADAPEIREGVRGLRDCGRDVEVRVTWEPGDARRFATEAVGRCAVVVAGGGDGTVSEVADALAAAGSTTTALAILPLGTANDFATSAGIPTDDIGEALRLAVKDGAGRPVDVIRCGERRLLNVATAGPATRVTVQTPDGLKRALGSLSYAVSGVTQMSTFEAQEGTLRGPDFEWSGRFLALAVGNGRQAGGGIVLCPDAHINDGLMDIRVIPEGEGAGALLLDGLLRGRDAALEGVSIGWRGRWLEIETEQTLNVNLDGEPLEGTSFRFDVEPEALRMVLPEDSPLLSR